MLLLAGMPRLKLALLWLKRSRLRPSIADSDRWRLLSWSFYLGPFTSECKVDEFRFLSHSLLPFHT